MLENICHLHLRRHRELLGYPVTASGREVDFVLARDGELELVQACASIEQSSTREREVASLGEAIAETGAKAATIVTLDEEGAETVGGVHVRIIPVWRWLLR